MSSPRRPARPRPRQRHLLDLDDPRHRARAGSHQGMSLTTVQQWVLSALAVTTILHFAAGLAIAAVFADERAAQIGLNVIAGVVGVLAVAAGLAIHRRSPLSPWLVLGVLPGLVGAWFALR